MKIDLVTLGRYTDLPADPRATRVLLDEVGIEVKRIDPEAPGVPVTLELLANRGDHHCYVGIAREVSGRTGGALRQPEPTRLETGSGSVIVRCETELCPVYTATLLERHGDGTFDPDALALLASCGVHSLGPVIDATNVANLELGQPTHAFDADTLDGPITIRLSRPGETALPLFASERVALAEGTMVIADDSKVLAVAGVIGCEESKTTDSTTRVVLESAGFDPVAVRKASRGLGIHTDSSARFERGSDFAAPLAGAGRVVQLLEQAGWQRVGPTEVVSSWSDPGRVVELDTDAARAFLEIDDSEAQLGARLTRYGFEITASTAGPPWLSVGVPTHRLWEVEHPSDLYEELARSIGYDNTPVSLPPVDRGAVAGHEEVVKTAAEEVLLGHGFYEVITDGFHARALSERLGLPDGHPLLDHVGTTNALERAYSLLKNNGLAQALDGLAANLRVLNPQVKAYEWTRTFHPDPTAANGVCSERRILWALANGGERPAGWSGTPRAADALFLKGVVAELALALRLPLQFAPADPGAVLHDVLHPNRQLSITLRGEVVGILGEVHPRVVKEFRIKRSRPCYLEIGLDALLAESKVLAFVPPPRKHPVVRNLAFSLPHRVQARSVADVMLAAGPSWLSQVDIVDLFEHEADGVALRTFTYALTYSAEDADRSAHELNATTEALVEAVVAALGDRGVHQRA